jgi:uncharacterized protein
MMQTDVPIGGGGQPGPDIPPAGVPPTSIPPAPGPIPPLGREANKDARMWGMFCHLAGLCFLLPIVPGIGAVIGPLIVWVLRKETSPFVDEQGKEAVNFQITMLIYGIISTVLLLACIGIVLLPAVAVIDIVLAIIAAVKANDGHHYRYPKPFIIRFIK